MPRAIGLLVNPIAGIGGPAGLKGSDGAMIQTAAIDRGATPQAGSRATHALSVIARSSPGLVVLTAAGAMGEDSVLAAGLVPKIVYWPPRSGTDRDDTLATADALVAGGAGLILFAGGDGTARDLCDANLGDTLVLGVPAGVKMYSGCFAVSPAAGGVIASRYLAGEISEGTPREVLDADEEQIRLGRVDPTLYGLLPVPLVKGRTQARKSSSGMSQAGNTHQAASGVVAKMESGVAYLLGPGSTLAEVSRLLDVPSTLLGIDVVRNGELILADASERQLLHVIGDQPAKAIVSVIGGQGFLLGRGNQQISARVLLRLGRDPLLVVATEDKLLGLGGSPLLVDTGDRRTDSALSGYIPVITGINAVSMYPVQAADFEGA